MQCTCRRHLKCWLLIIFLQIYALQSFLNPDLKVHGVQNSFPNARNLVSCRQGPTRTQLRGGLQGFSTNSETFALPTDSNLQGVGVAVDSRLAIKRKLAPEVSFKQNGIHAIANMVRAKWALSKEKIILFGDNPLRNMSMSHVLDAEDCERIARAYYNRNSVLNGNHITSSGSYVPLSDIISGEQMSSVRNQIESAVRATYPIQGLNITVNNDSLRIGTAHDWIRNHLSTSSSTSQKRSLPHGKESSATGDLVAVRYLPYDSLVTFTILLEERTLRVKLLQSGTVFSLSEVGTGLIMCGLVRHVLVADDIRSNDAAESGQPLLLLWGTVKFDYVCLRGDMHLWRWNRPRWLVNHAYIKDEALMDLCWRVRPDGGQATLPRLEGPAHRYYRALGMPRPRIRLKAKKPWFGDSDKVTVYAYDSVTGTVVGRAGLSTNAGASPMMDKAVNMLFNLPHTSKGIKVAPITYVYVDPRYRGYGFGRDLTFACMRFLAQQKIEYTVVTVLDNGKGKLPTFYEKMGFKKASQILGISGDNLSEVMVAPTCTIDTAKM